MGKLTREVEMAGRDSDGAWAAEAPVSVAYKLVSASPGDWYPAPEELGPLELRELGLTAATNRSLGAWHVRVGGDARGVEIDWHCHDLDFEFIYVLSGSLEIEPEGAPAVTLSASDAVMTPASLRRRTAMSGDYEALVFSAPGEPGRLAVDAPRLARSWWAGAAPIYLQDGEQAFERRGLRTFFEYRDLGTVDPTGGRVGANILRATEASSGGTGWHFHSMGQLVVVLCGTAEVDVGGQGRVVTGPLDSMCVGAGVVHNVHSFTDYYSLIEFCLPAVYDTVAIELK
jgi:quercetin dioxygenase-like cupin family protein